MIETNEKTASTKGALLTNSNVKNIRVTLSSRGPGLLMNPMSYETLLELAGEAPKAASDKNIPIEDRAKKRIIREDGATGKAGIPSTYLLAALIYAGRFVKNGKDKISTASTTTLYEFLTIDEEFFPFVNQEEEPITDLRRGVLNNKGDKVAVAIIRPKYKNWQISFNISIENIGEEVIKQLFEAAGKKSGLGDFRPSRKGPFGMFTVTGWEALDSKN